MNKVRELKIDSTLWATPAKIINLLDFKPEKLSVETKSTTNNDIKFHQVRFENGGFYLTIDNIRGYFNLSNNLGILDFKPEKLSVETKSTTNNDIKFHQVRFENGGFYLTIDNIRGYFNLSNNLGILTMIFDNDDQKNKYHQIWKERK